MINFRALQIAGVFAIAQHGDAVGQFLHFAKPMRNVNDTHAARAQVLDHGEQVFRLALGQAAGGFVHDQHAGIDGQRLGDLHHLLAPHGQFAHED